MTILSKTLRVGARLLAAPYSVISGVEPGSNQTLDILWSGPEEHRAYLSQRIFRDKPSTARTIGRHSLLSVDALLDRHNCQMSLVVGPRSLMLRSMPDTDMQLPLWVTTEVPIDNDSLIRQSRDVRTSVKRFQKNGYDWNITSRPGDMRAFFDSIYLPTIQKSHGAAALPTSVSDRLKQLERGDVELLQVLLDGKSIAGLIIDYRHTTPALREIGVLDGSKTIKRTGVIPSLNYFAFEHLGAHGYETASLGMSRCFLNDGVLQFKRKFGTAVSDGSLETIFMRIPTLTPALRSMLCANPCFSWRDKNLVRTFFQDTHFETTLADANHSLLGYDFGIQAMQILEVSGARLPGSTADFSRHLSA